MRTICLFLSGVSLSACAHAQVAAIPPQSDSRPVANVPLQDEVDEIAWSGRNFNRAEFRVSLRDAAFEARHCVSPPTKLDAIIPHVTFQPSGEVTDVHIENVSDETLAACIAEPFARIKIDPFSGNPLTSRWSFADIYGADANRRAMVNR
jgi:hypothetical protein